MLLPYRMEIYYMVRDKHGKFSEKLHPELVASFKPDSVEFSAKATRAIKIPVALDNARWPLIWQEKGTVKSAETDIRVIPSYLHSFNVFKTPKELLDADGKPMRHNQHQYQVVKRFAESVRAHLTSRS